MDAVEFRARDAGRGACDATAAVCMVTAPAAAVRHASASPANGLVMLDQRHGVLIGEGVRAGQTGDIQFTSDGGDHWRPVFASTHALLGWVGRDGRDLVASGSHGRDPQDSSTPSRPLLLGSRDGGRTWVASYPRVPGVADLDRLSFSGRGAVLSVLSAADIGVGSPAWGNPPGLLGSRDDGRIWYRVRLPDRGVADSGVAGTGHGRTAFVTGGPNDPRCASAVWRRDDAGASWRLLRRSCLALDQYAVTFSDPRHGLVAGGDWSSASQRGTTIVRSTSDSGAHWRTLWEHHSSGLTPEYPLDSLAFVDRHGWALFGAIKLGAATNYSGEALVTSDGGRQWHDTAQHATALVTLGSRGALVIAGDAKNDSLGPLARTLDLGAHWTQLAVRNKTARAPCCITA